MNTYTNKFDKSLAEKIKTFFIDNNFVIEAQQYAFFRAKSNVGIAVFYQSGKFLMQGKDVSSIVLEFEKYMGISSVDNTEITQKSVINHNYEKYIGVDESGKGDFFGPLIVGGVLITPKNRELFIKLGIKDSKKLKDDVIKKMALEIQKNAIFSLVVITPQKYNELYDKFKNLNKLLAWGHARVIENILEKEDCEYAISDKFGKDEFINKALMEKGRKIKLDQFCKGEEDIAVAAASVIARAEFVKRMKSMEINYQLNFPKGASDKVIAEAKNYCAKYGKQRLNEVAKLHFKTVNSL